MTMVLNVSTQRLKVKGVSVGPREMGDIPVSKSQLSDHLFVRSGMLEISGGKVTSAASPAHGGAKSAAEVIAEIAEMTNLDDLQAAMDDKRKTVSEAAEKRIAELDESGDAGDSSDNGDNQ